MTDSLRSKVLSGLFWSVAQSWSLKLVSLLLFMVLARVLDPHELGVFAIVMVVLGFVNIFVDQGLSEAIVQRAQISVQQLNTAFLINFTLSLLIFALLWFIAPLIADHLKIVELTAILRVATVGILVSAITFSQQAMLQRNFCYRWLATCALVSTLVSGAAALFFALHGFGVWSLVIQALTASVVSAVMLWFHPQWRFSFDLDFAGVRSLLRYGLNRLLISLIDFANLRYIDIFLVAALGPVALGIYSVGVRIYQALGQALSSAIVGVVHNGFSRVAHDRPRLVAAYYKAFTFTTASVVPLFCLLSAIAPEAIVVLFGSKWAGSADVLRPMAFLGAVQALETYNDIAFKALGKPSISLKIVVFRSVVTFLTLWVMREPSLSSVVYAYVASQIVTIPLTFYLVRRIVGVSLRTLFSHIWRFLTACAIGVTVISLGRHISVVVEMPVLAKLLILSAAGSLSYLGFLAVTARAQLREMLTMVRVRRQPI
ncbi:lipopolysaccharide biosynthesis protein [Sulfuriferula multivorans]|nr:lipopolysaccharide biosynthesis protein [Sulfuriferula multivorans]